MTLQNIFSNKMEISLNIAGILLITNRLKMASNWRFVMAFCKNRMKPFVLLKGVFKRTSKKHFLLLTRSFAMLYRR